MTFDKFLPFSFDWSTVPIEKAAGMRGMSMTKKKTMGNINVRRVEYSPDYVANEWSDKGHVVIVIEGQLIIEHKGGSIHSLHAGMVHMVGDDSRAHKAKSKNGAMVFIVD